MNIDLIGIEISERVLSGFKWCLLNSYNTRTPLKVLLLFFKFKTIVSIRKSIHR